MKKYIKPKALIAQFAVDVITASYGTGTDNGLGFDFGTDIF